MGLILPSTREKVSSKSSLYKSFTTNTLLMLGLVTLRVLLLEGRHCRRRQQIPLMTNLGM